MIAIDEFVHYKSFSSSAHTGKLNTSLRTIVRKIGVLVPGNSTLPSVQSYVSSECSYRETQGFLTDN